MDDMAFGGDSEMLREGDQTGHWTLARAMAGGPGVDGVPKFHTESRLHAQRHRIYAILLRWACSLLGDWRKVSDPPFPCSPVNLCREAAGTSWSVTSDGSTE